MTTVKNSTKAQMFRVEDRAPVMEWVKATGKLAAWNWGPHVVPAGALAGPVEGEEQAYAQGSGDMCQIEEQPRTAAGEDPGAHHPQDKGGT